MVIASCVSKSVVNNGIDCIRPSSFLSEDGQPKPILIIADDNSLLQLPRRTELNRRIIFPYANAAIHAASFLFENYQYTYLMQVLNNKAYFKSSKDNIFGIPCKQEYLRTFNLAF